MQRFLTFRRAPLRLSFRRWYFTQSRGCCAAGGTGAAAAASSSSSPGVHEAYDPRKHKLAEKYPIVQLPARSLWCAQYPLDLAALRAGEFDEMIARVQAARHYYQYPSLCAPQIGWNVQMFSLFDGSVFINPVNHTAAEWAAAAARQQVSPAVYEEQKMAELRRAGQTCFAWEPCASCCFLMHYIERPSVLRISAYNAKGEMVTQTLDKMRARMALHELDHLSGILFTRRVVDTDHVVPLEGFSGMSDWSDDYPSLEARSTFLYTTFTPPYHFKSDSVADGNLLDRKFEEGIYPGCERDRELRLQSAALEELQRSKWRKEKKRAQEPEVGQTAEDNRDVSALGHEEEHDANSDGEKAN